MKKRYVLCAATLLGGTALVTPLSPAKAQEEANSTSEDIIVTGSRIRRDPLSEATPVVTLDQDSLAQTGLSSVADVLQRLPSSSGGINTKNNSSSNLGNPPDGGGVGAGSAEIDLRYLGSKRTLVLVDGVRYVNGTAGSGIPASVDLNTIPASMIERIEVLQSAASPLYGSDAIAGVVNIITKSAQKGLQASAQFGLFRQGDGQTQDYNLSYGIKGPTTSVVLGASYVKQDAVHSRDRAISRFPRPYATSCLAGGCSDDFPGRIIVNDFGNPANTAGLDLAPRINVTGRPRFDPANPTGPNSDFQTPDPANFLNTQDFNYILTPSERYGFWVSAKQQLGSDITFRLKAVYNRRNSVNQAAPLPLGVGPAARNGNMLDFISIDATNPFNPFGVTLSAGGPGQGPSNYFLVGHRLREGGPRTNTQTVDTMTVTGGLDGSFRLGDRKWYWDMTAILGYNDGVHTLTANVDGDLVARALGPVANCTAPCVALNLFGGAGSVTPAMLAYIRHTQLDKSNQRLFDFNANLSGELFDLPAGPVGVAVGFEHRNQKGSFTSDLVVAAGRGADIPAQSYAGRFTVNEVYGEVRVPLFKDTPFFRLLELNGAVRRSDYSTFGVNTVYTGGVLWKPVEDLLLRGSYAESVRAPGIGESFGTRTRFDGTFVDPCTDINGTRFGVVASATVRANCIANGVPANGSYQEPTASLPVITGGNPSLVPETARTILLGFAYNPSWARDSGFASNLSLEANYYDIKLDGAISAIGADVLLDRCARTGDALSCGSITRAANGFITQVDALLKNIGGVRTKGIDVTLNYRSDETKSGSFGLALNAAFLLKYLESVPSSNGFTVIDRKGTERGSPDQAFPKFKGNAVASWTLNGFTAAYTGRYISGVTETQNGNRMNSRFYSDVQLSFSPAWLEGRTALTIGVNNLFDKDPPACTTCSLNGYDPTTYDVPGQFGYVRLSYRM